MEIKQGTDVEHLVGSDVAHLIGSVVSVDVTNHHGELTVTGVLVSVLDRIQQDDVVETVLTVGAERIVLDWQDKRTTARLDEVRK